jgi:hypothetical protein
VGERGWQRKFDDPIELPDGAQLNTLHEAVAYLAKTVPKSERNMTAVDDGCGDAGLRGGARDRLGVFGAHGRPSQQREPAGANQREYLEAA